MACVNHQRHEEGVQRIKGGEQQRYQHELHGAGENCHAGQDGIPDGEAHAGKVQAEGHA